MLKEGKDPRICVDLSRSINPFLEVPSFEYPSVWDAVRLAKGIRRGTGGPAYMGKLDLSSCFLSFPVAEEDYTPGPPAALSPDATAARGTATGSAEDDVATGSSGNALGASS